MKQPPFDKTIKTAVSLTTQLIILLTLAACSLIIGQETTVEGPPLATAVTPTAASSTEPTAAAPEPTSDDTTAGSINGRIWHDICVNQGDPLDGCIAASDDNYQANGLMDDNEPGITDILVRLGSGACPNITTNSGTVLGMNETAIAATTTDTNGDFLFIGLQAGTYCLMVNTLDEPNRNLLLPGNWTSENKGLQTITLNPGETFTTNFGWDHDYLPISNAALNCQDSAEFVADVTIPDDTAVAAGTVFTKTWRIRNVGTCDWTPAYALTFVDGYELDGPKIIPITTTIVPTNTIDFTVALTAPVISGTFRADWQIYNANQKEFFGIFGNEPIWVQIVVTEPLTITAVSTPTSTTPITATVTATATVNSTPTFANAALSGLVWEDLDSDGLQSEKESPLRGITVAIYRDECPGRILVTTQTTNLGGGYVFTNLAPGSYCVIVDAFTPENISLLSPGDWVYPEIGTGSQTISLQSGENLTDVNFGWQFAEEE
ncbi:MAG: hypothetical protein H6658_03980 [Ardenticatenaceae bacterium]|nr:hypothetical protein [Ardenticatenaceae bacterium]